MKALPEVDRQTLHNLLEGMYLNDECYAFAIALHRGLGWPIVGIVHQGVPLHVGVRSPRGIIYDARGAVSRKKFPLDINGMRSPHKILLVAESTLFAQRPISPNSITTALRISQSLWPQLPWRRSTFSERIKRFLADFKRLCKKHRVWMRPAFPSAAPILYEAYGDEVGYEVRPTGTGQEYFIDRLL